MSKKRLFFSLMIFSFILINGCVNKDVDIGTDKVDAEKITNFIECTQAGNPIMESYPRQCRTENGKLFVEEINEEQEPEHGESSEAIEKEPSEPREDWSVLYTKLEGCEEKDVIFTSLPLDIENIKVVEPQGELTNSGHVVPGDHVGFQYDSSGPKINVYAIGDGYIKRVERNMPFGDLKSKNYHLYFEFSCTMFGSYVHVTEIAREILNADQEFKQLDSYDEGSIPEDKRYIWPKIPVKAGQVIGSVDEWGLLGMLTVDTDITLTGFINPEKYKGEPWKIHAVPPFGYFSKELEDKLMEKNPRKKEPRGGKIDFDAPGRLSGNWFLEGTNFAGGKEAQPVFCGKQLCPYWNGHLAFVYDFIDPDQIRVSFGDYSGWYPQGPYGVKGNIDPVEISKIDGIVKLEFVSLDDIGDECGFSTEGKALCTRNSNNVAGVMLVQMLNENKIKIELFPSKTSSQVSDFTRNAKIYER